MARGGPDLAFGAAGWGWIGAIALVSTVGAILAFFAGLARVGPSAAAILSVFEPVVTVALAAAVFGESLALVQLAGGALVLAGGGGDAVAGAAGGRGCARRRRRRRATAGIEGVGRGRGATERR